MKAYVRTSATDQTVELIDVPAPSMTDDTVLVSVQAFGVGVHDRYFIPAEARFPWTIGIEAAGIVTAVGASVEHVAVDDRVMVTTLGHAGGQVAFLASSGTWTEQLAVHPDGLRPMPDELDFSTAAAIPVAGNAAVESIHTLDLSAGETLYVAGASGAIGPLVVQMATERGARVVGSASPQNHDFLHSLGVELAVDYRDPAWPDQVRQWAPGGVDAALAIQPGTPSSSQDVVRDGGRVVTVSGDPCPPERGISVEQFGHRADTDGEMDELVQAITSGRIRMELEHVYPFDQALQALEKTETRHARGKLVVTVP